MAKKKGAKKFSRKVRIVVGAILVVLFILLGLILYTVWSFETHKNDQPSKEELVSFQKVGVDRAAKAAEKRVDQDLKSIKTLVPSTARAEAISKFNECYIESEAQVFSSKFFKKCYLRKTLFISSSESSRKLSLFVEKKLKSKGLKLLNNEVSDCYDSLWTSIAQKPSWHLELEGTEMQVGSLKECPTTIAQQGSSNPFSFYANNISESESFDDSVIREKAVKQGRQSFMIVAVVDEYFNETIWE